MIHSFEEAIKFEGEARKVEILERLKDYNDSDLLDLCQDANSYDGSFDFVEAYDLEELCEITTDAYDIARAIVFGNVEGIDDPVRYNAYGNLESVSKYALEDEARDNIEELAEWLMDGWHNVICLYGDEPELFEAWDDIDSGTYTIAELLGEEEEDE